MIIKVKNQHYIPRFYLKSFGENNRVDVYDKCQKKFFPNANVNNFASQNYFYDVNIDNNQIKKELDLMFKIYGHQYTTEEKEKIYKNPQLIEEYFARIEGDISALFKEFESNNELIKDKFFLIKFYIFISSLAIRTAGYRDKLINLNEQLFSQAKKLGIDKIHDVDVNSDPKEVAKKIQLEQIMSLSHTFINSKIFFNNYDFYVGINETGYPFIISDEVAFNVELFFKDICFPITPKLAIIMRVKDTDPKYYISKDTPNGNIIKLTHQGVFSYNILQYYQAKRYVFGSMKEIQRLQTLSKLLTNPQIRGKLRGTKN